MQEHGKLEVAKEQFVRVGKSQAREITYAFSAKRNEITFEMLLVKTHSACKNVLQQLNSRVKTDRHLFKKYIIRESTFEHGTKMRIKSPVGTLKIIIRPPCSPQGVHYFGREATRRIELRQCTRHFAKSIFSFQSRKPGKARKEGARNNPQKGAHYLISMRYTTILNYKSGGNDRTRMDARSNPLSHWISRFRVCLTPFRTR